MNIQEMWLQAQLAKQGGVPGPGNNPALLAAMQQQSVPQSQADPLGSGALTAMHTVRQALAERPKQTSMLGGVLDSVGKTLQNIGIARLRGSHRGPTAELGRMMQTPDEMEAANTASNMQVLNFLADQARVAQDAQYKRDVLKEQTQHRKDALAEQRRYHDILANKGSAASKFGQSQDQFYKMPNGKIVDLSEFSPITSQSEKGAITKDKRLLGKVMHATESAIEKLSNYEESVNGRYIKPTDPLLGGVGSYLMNTQASYGVEASKDARIKTKLLNDALTQIRTMAESGAKNGTPGEQMMKRWEHEGILPHLRDGPDVIRAKLEAIKNELAINHGAADLSLKTGRIFDAVDYGNLIEDEIEDKDGTPKQPSSLEGMSDKDIEAEIRAIEGSH